MHRILRGLVVACALSLPLGACGSMGDFAIDPTEWIPDDLFGLNAKKKLPGERRAVFPEGVPGVERGVPPELVKGNQPPPDALADVALIEPDPAPPPEAKPKPKARAKPKPKPKVAAKPAPVEPEPEARSVTVRPASRQSSASQWPDPPPPRQGSTGGGVQWPDPPAR